MTVDGGIIFSVTDAQNATYVNTIILGGDVVDTYAQAPAPNSGAVLAR